MKVVVAAYGSRGDTEPGIAVAGELQRRGHDVRLAVTVPSELRAYVTSAGLSTEPYGRDWQELLGDGEFARMLQHPMNAIPQAVEYVAQVSAEKNAALLSLADGADLLVAGMTEQEPVANVAEHYGIPAAALHFFPPEILQQGPPQQGMTRRCDQAQRRALGLAEQPRPCQPLEVQAYDEVCLPGLATVWGEAIARRPFVGALTLQLPTETDADVLSWISAGPPPVYFGFGSMPIATPGDMVAVIGAACSRVGVRALICLGPHHYTDAPQSDQVKVVREINHAAVLPVCRAVVHHGGAGTTAAGLRAGVPNLLLWSGLDQPVWAGSVGHLEVGFGRRFSESTLDTLTSDLGILLSSRYDTRAREVASLMTAPVDSLTRAVDLLEAEAARGRSG